MTTQSERNIFKYEDISVIITTRRYKELDEQYDAIQKDL